MGDTFSHVSDVTNLSSRAGDSVQNYIPSQPHPESSCISGGICLPESGCQLSIYELAECFGETGL